MSFLGREPLEAIVRNSKRTRATRGVIMRGCQCKKGFFFNQLIGTFLLIDLFLCDVKICLNLVAIKATYQVICVVGGISILIVLRFLLIL